MCVCGGGFGQANRDLVLSQNELFREDNVGRIINNMFNYLETELKRYIKMAKKYLK